MAIDWPAFSFFLIKGLIWLDIFYGLWDVIKGSVS